MVKSGFTIKVVGTLCAMCKLSVPTPAMLKLNVPAVALFTVTVNGAPAAVGVTLDGLTVQVEGGAPVHDRFTGLL